jgi:hypothetical protein
MFNRKLETGSVTEAGKKRFEHIRNTWESYGINKLELEYVMNKFLHYKRIHALLSPLNDITYWAKKPFMDLCMHIYSLDEHFHKKELLGKQEKENTLLFENEFVRVCIPRNYFAACKYGANTRWCITSSMVIGYWHQYYNETAYPVFILPKKSNEKICIYTVNNRIDHATDKEDTFLYSFEIYWLFIKYDIPMSVLPYKFSYLVGDIKMFLKRYKNKNFGRLGREDFNAWNRPAV